MVSCIKHKHTHSHFRTHTHTHTHTQDANTDGTATKQVTLCNTSTDLSITTKDIAVIMDEMVVEQ